MTSEFLKKRLARIDLFLQENYIDTGKIPGAQILVAKNGKIEHFSNLGLIDVDKDNPMKFILIGNSEWSLLTRTAVFIFFGSNLINSFIT